MLDVEPLILDELNRLAPYEPAAGGDWQTVLARAGAIHPSRRLPRKRVLWVAVAGLLLLIALAAPALGLGPPFLDFFSAKHAPKRVVHEFAIMGVGAPRGMNPHVIPGQTRLVTTYHLRNGKRMPLWVAPTRGGGFCYVLGGGGCVARHARIPDRNGDLNVAQLDVGRFSNRGLRIIEGSVANEQTTKLQLRFADGRQVTLPLLWVSPPISRGFYLYQLTDAERQPSHRPTEIVAFDQKGRVLARVVSIFRLPPPWSNPNNVSNRADRHVILRSGPLTIAIAPSRTGGNCSWLQYQGKTIGSGCAPPRFQTEPMAGGLSHGTGVTGFDAQLKPDVARVVLRFQDGASLTLRPVQGHVLYNIPKAHWPRQHRLFEADAYNANGHKLATQKFDPHQIGLYDCTKTIPIGAGQRACP
jgi:hypothetical protein